ncbi:peptidoglycan-associated lipoprotein Pal [Orbus mooreae]|uniref:peptidoglycan-associated lipoprotein Pal n=1 Tax=Orbus mooreae TaxID=3074107 RepID=UPI00370D1689
MQFLKLIKGAVIVLPLIAATACTSTSDKSMNGANGANGAFGNLTEAQQLQQLQAANTVYFDFDKYNIKPDFARALDTHAEFLRAHPSFNVVIEGHADERGTPEYNIALGERRAAAVKAYLQGRGVSANQMTIVSYGKEKPAVLGHDEQAYEKNRRAVIVY